MSLTSHLKNDCIVQLLVIKKGYFLGMFEHLRRANISFVISFRLSIHIEQVCSQWTDFHDVVWKPAKKIQVSVNYDKYNRYFTRITMCICGPGSVVGIATAYGLDGPGIEYRWGEIFRTPPDRPWGPPSLLYNEYRVFPGGKVRPGRDADPSPPSSAEV